MLGVVQDIGISRTQFNPVDKSLLGVIETITNDSKLAGLFELIRRTEFNPIRDLELSVVDSGNIYIVGLVGNNSRELMIRYFKEGNVSDSLTRQQRITPYLTEYFYGLSSPPSLSVDFLKAFEDGTIQFSAFGDEWESQPRNAWGVYGHIVSERKSG